MKSFDILSFGEALIDFTPDGENSYKANPGGAPYNLAVCAARCGSRVAFMGKIGEDGFGKLLLDTAVENNVATSGFIADPHRPTTHAFVTPGADGNNGFVFCRDHGADIAIDVADVDVGLIKNARHFHFGGLSLAAEPCKGALLYAIKEAKNLGLTTSFDPNYRPLLWKSGEEFKKVCLALPFKVDYLKVAEEEARLITGIDDLEKAAQSLKAIAHTVLITLGADGAMLLSGDRLERIKGYPAAVKDTTGAGDIFFGCFLSRVLKGADIAAAVDSACRIAAKSTEKAGAIPSIPEINF